jgi:hypothetical protein
MGRKAGLGRGLLLAAILTATLAFGPGAAARNVIAGFTKAPTFTPPADCAPNMETYGVVSGCTRMVEPGHPLSVLIDTAVVLGANDLDRIIDDHVTDIRTYWRDNYSQKKLVFSSRKSGVVPHNAPPDGASCREYSVTVEVERNVLEGANAPRFPVVSHTEGLTCAWHAKVKAPVQHDIEIFWLEVTDEYVPAFRQEPAWNYDTVVRDVFGSARL